jgi:hypothetical protein
MEFSRKYVAETLFRQLYEYFIPSMADSFSGLALFVLDSYVTCGVSERKFLTAFVTKKNNFLPPPPRATFPE